nr:maleylpyruvate isomerase N-terminal domain-containing protein [Micromonospora sp. DSM 115978]
MDIFDDLAAEQQRLETFLEVLDEADWAAPSGAPGWSVADVVLHLAQTEEAVVASTSSGELGQVDWTGGRTVDQAADDWVRAESAAHVVVFYRW